MVTKIIVDADACPVKPEIVQAANEFDIQAVMVASFDHQLTPMKGVKIVQVDRSDQSVDLYISNYITSKDIVVTQDLGLAAIALGKGAIVLSNRGQVYDNHTMDFMLESRHEFAKQRRSGKYSKGPRKMLQIDREKFLQTLTKILLDLQENS